MTRPVSKLVTLVGQRTGQFLTNLTYVVATLLIYAGLSLLTYLWLAMTLPSPGQARFVAYEISTGGDPFNFSSDLYRHTWLWRWILLFHVISWLVVPVLAATAVDAAFRLWEQRRIELDKKLISHMVKIIVEHSGLDPEQAERLAMRARRGMEKTLSGLESSKNSDVKEQ